MNWKIISTLTVSAVVVCGGLGTIRPTMAGRVTKATVHGRPSDAFLLDHLWRQYSNDMQSVTGRVKWHGRPIRQEIDGTNRMCKIERYADGTVHIEPFRTPSENWAARTNNPAWRKSAEKRKEMLAKRRAQIAAKRSVLPGLTDAQLKTFDNKNAESNVTVNVNIGGAR